jgi:hypothetical protein
MEMTTLDELENLLKAGTPRPWFLSGVRFKMNGSDWHGVMSYNEAKKQDDNVCLVGYDPRTGEGHADAALIVAAINALPGLLESARRVEKLETRDRVLIDVASSLAAAISLLERGGKKAAASDKMFEQMLTDYRGSLNRARALLKGT